MAVMIKLGRAFVILPGSTQDSGTYAGACEALGLHPSLHGQAIFLAETSAGSLTLVSAELGEPHAIQDAATGGADRAALRKTGNQRGATARVRGNRLSRGTTEVVEIRLAGNPIARVVVREPGRTCEGVTAEAHPVPKPARKAEPEGRAEAAAGEAVAEVLAEAFVGTIWPVSPSTGTLKDYESLYRAAEFLLEPETLLLKVINASARAAAHAAGLGILAPLAGQLAEALCAPLLRPSPESRAAADMVKIVDIKLYLEGGQLAECPALRELTVATVAAEIGKSLGSRSDPQLSSPPLANKRAVRSAPARASAAQARAAQAAGPTSPAYKSAVHPAPARASAAQARAAQAAGPTSPAYKSAVHPAPARASAAQARAAQAAGPTSPAYKSAVHPAPARASAAQARAAQAAGPTSPANKPAVHPAPARASAAQARAAQAAGLTSPANKPAVHPAPARASAAPARAAQAAGRKSAGRKPPEPGSARPSRG